MELPAELMQKEIEKYLREHRIYTEPKAPTRLANPYNKWFKGKNGRNNGLILQALGGAHPTTWKSWDAIRRLTCIIVGASFIRDIKDIDRAEEVCERLCQFVYDMITDGEKSNE